MTPVISVSIGSYNRRDWLLRAIDALAVSELTAPFELCVVLDACTDGSAAAVRSRFATLPAHITPILVEHPYNSGVGRVHQSSLEATSAPVAAFIDDDCVPAPDFLPRLLARLEAAGPAVVGVGGFITPQTRNTLNRRYLGASDPHRPTEADFIGASFVRRLRLAVRPPRRDGVRPVYALVGGAMAFRRDALLAVGGFATDIRFGGFETRLCEALRARFGDAALLADPAIVVAHDYHPDLRGTLRRALRAGAAIGRDFVRRGGLPSLRPNPVLIIGAVITGLFYSPAVALLAGLVTTYALYGRVARGGHPERPLYPLLFALEEGAKNVGFLGGLWAHRQEWRREMDRRFVDLIWIAAAIAVSFLVRENVAASVITVATLLLAPGAILLGVARAAIPTGGARVVIAVALSVLLLMALSLVLSVGGPLLGVDRPLDAAFAAPLLALAGLLLAAVSFVRGESGLLYLARGIHARDVRTAAVALLLPVAAVLGAERLNAGLPGDLALAVTALTALLLLGALALALAGRRPPVATLLFFSVLATAYAVSARGTLLFGWDIQKEFSVGLETIARGRWVVPADHDAYAAMLSLTGLPALIGVAGALDLAEVFRFVFPVFSALTVVGVYVLTRRVAPAGPALAAIVLLVVASLALPRGMQAIARQEVAFLLFAALLLVAFASRLPDRTKAAGVVLAGLGIAVAHYSTGYATLALLVATLLATTLLRRLRPGIITRRVFSPLVVLLVAVGVVGWNAGVNQATSEASSLSFSISRDGLQLLPGSDTGDFLSSWINGAGGARVPVAEYHAAVLERVQAANWMRVHPDAAGVTLSDAAAARVGGLVPPLAPLYDLANLFVRQGVLALIIIAVIAGLVAAWRRRSVFGAEAAALAFAALVMVALLRVSGTVAGFYNPERGALHAALIYAPAVAILLATLLRRTAGRVEGGVRVALAGSAAIALTSALALAPQLFGGSPSAAHANAGEEYERLAISRAEYATATWLTGRSDPALVVFADRYGQIVLLSMPRDRITYLGPTIDPAGVDAQAYIYASRANIIEGRARGSEDGGFAIFTFPRDFYEGTRAILYATEATRVYR
jgi:uncharacterized membrane protein/GT2 family glycosyltransferase